MPNTPVGRGGRGGGGGERGQLNKAGGGEEVN